MSGEWYYTHRSERYGPVSFDFLRQRRTSGELNPNDLVWCDGMAQWAPASTIAELGFDAAQPQVSAPPTLTEPSIPNLTTVAYAQPHQERIMCTARTIQLFQQTRPWVRLLGILILIMSGLMFVLATFMLLGNSVFTRTRQPGPPLAVLSVVYYALALIYVAPGLYLNRYASRITELVHNGLEDSLERTVEAQKTFWKFCGIFALVILGIYVLGIVAIIIAAVLR